MTNEQSINILNDVLETLIDSRDGYEKASEIADRETFKQFFARRAASRNAMAVKVQDEIRGLGGEPDSDGTILAKGHRAFLSISAALQDNDEAAIEAVEDGEEYLRNKVGRALEENKLGPSLKATLQNLNGELRADGRVIDHLESSV